MISSYRSFAKVNLHLQVVGRRGDGYHELRTVFQTIELHDLLTVSSARSGIEFTVAGADVPAGPANLAYRAAASYLERWAPSASVRLHLQKRVPVGGGLGGGSGNAATVLLALRERFSAPASVLDLWPLARALGADVPYFLAGGTALGVGRGDEIVPLPELPESELWIAVPAVSVSTASIFSALVEKQAAPLAPEILALAAGSSRTVATLEGFNDLQSVVLAAYPQVADLYSALLRLGAPWVRLSGSGGCLFSPPWQGRPPAELARELPRGTKFLQTRTLNRESVEAQRRIDS
jgi:4-diphosphocytidyl-2-C-methyl-D-erythritol kinase